MRSIYEPVPIRVLDAWDRMPLKPAENNIWVDGAVMTITPRIVMIKKKDHIIPSTQRIFVKESCYYLQTIIGEREEQTIASHDIL
jgi:hypothetical protein